MDAPTTHAPAHVLAGRFMLERVLGTGGMATVWSAHDRRLGRTVAVKILHADLSAEHAERIEREARAVARINDPRVVTVLDLDHDFDGTPFIVLEALSGHTLADELKRGPLAIERGARLGSDLLGALGAAHAVGVLHRDVKPSNVLVDGEGFRITDFGIASVADENATSGDLMGTLVYLAPERFDGAAATPQSDVFAAAVVLYEAFTGTQPFRSPSTTESLARLRSAGFEPLPSQVPAWLAEPIGAALDPDPDRRPADANAFARMIETPAGRSVDALTDRIEGGDPTVVQAPTHGHTVRLPTAPVDPAPPGPRSPGSGVTDGRAHVRHRVDALRDHPYVGAFGSRVREPRTIFVGLAILLFVLLFVALAGDGDDADNPANSADDPQLQLESQLDRLTELGR